MRDLGILKGIIAWESLGSIVPTNDCLGKFAIQCNSNACRCAELQSSSTIQVFVIWVCNRHQHAIIVVLGVQIDMSDMLFVYPPRLLKPFVSCLCDVHFALASTDIPDGVFMTYLSSVNNSVADWTVEAFEQTVGACVSLIQFSSGNHYAIADWNPHSAPYQVSLKLHASSPVAAPFCMFCASCSARHGAHKSPPSVTINEVTCTRSFKYACQMQMVITHLTVEHMWIGQHTVGWCMQSQQDKATVCKVVVDAESSMW